MADIKSAKEIAQEKLDKIGEPTPEERLQWKYIPEGEKLAVQYLKDDINITAEINKYKDEAAKKYVKKGAENVLIKNITLPTTEYANNTNKKVMDTLKSIKQDKVAVENVYSQLRRIFTHYMTTGEEQRKQAYQELQIQFGQKIREALAQQGVSQDTRVDVERQPEFQSEWRKLSGRLDEQYLKYLEDFKKQLVAIK